MYGQKGRGVRVAHQSMGSYDLGHTRYGRRALAGRLGQTQKVPPHQWSELSAM